MGSHLTLGEADLATISLNVLWLLSTMSRYMGYRGWDLWVIGDAKGVNYPPGTEELVELLGNIKGPLSVFMAHGTSHNQCGQFKGLNNMGGLFPWEGHSIHEGGTGIYRDRNIAETTKQRVVSDLHLPDCIGQEPLRVHTSLKRGPKSIRGAHGLSVYIEKWNVPGEAYEWSGRRDEVVDEVLLLVQGS